MVASLSAAVSSVLDNGATEVVINIRTNRTHSIDGALGIELKKIGFDLGGLTQNSGATSLHIRQHPAVPQGLEVAIAQAGPWLANLRMVGGEETHLSLAADIATSAPLNCTCSAPQAVSS